MKNQESPVFDNGRGVFNPAAEIFTEVDRGSPMSGEFQAMESGTKHTLGTFDEERDAGGDELSVALVPALGAQGTRLAATITDGECGADGQFTIGFTSSNGAQTSAGVTPATATCTEAGCTFA